MKNLFVFIFLSFVFFTSCQDYLNTEPYSFTSIENFYKTAQDAELGLTGCYNILNTNSVQGVTGLASSATFRKSMHILLNAGTDELIPNPTNGLRADVGPFALHEVFSQNEVIQYNFFYWFAGINRVNYLLEKIKIIEMDEDRKNEIISEAHFLRGFCYTYLAMMYGGVQLYTTSVHNPNEQRNSLEEVYKLIISDFKYAYENLPDRASIFGRVNKWSAAGYLVKVYTYLGSCKKNNVGADLNFALNSFDWVNWKEMYDNAIDVTQDIINNGGYKLIERYDYLFRESTDSYKDMECLFYIMSSSNPSNGNYNQWNEFLIPGGNRNVVGGGTAILRPLAEVWDKYHSIDMRRAHNLVFQLRLTGDPIELIDGVRYYTPRSATAPTFGTYCVGKFRYMDPEGKPIENQLSIGATPILRYADILLLHAESLYFTGDEATARYFLSEVRKRSVTDESQLNQLNNGYLKNDFIEELLDERSRELCFEAWRRIDLIRFGKIGEVINDLNPDYGAFNGLVTQMQKNWESYKIWYPIPQNEIELSLIDQNPGY